MLSCAGADRLQSGMRQAFGKKYGVATQSQCGAIICSVRSTATHTSAIKSALRRGADKIGGRLKVRVGRTFGFTPIETELFRRLKNANRIVDRGTHVGVLRDKGLLAAKGGRVILVDGGALESVPHVPSA